MIVKMVKYFFVLLVYFCFVDVVNADLCNADEIKQLKQIADGIEVDYEYIWGENGEYTNKYDVSLNGDFSNIYIIVDDVKKYVSIDNKKIEFEVSANNFPIKFYAKKCGELLKTVNLELPSFNWYSLNSECDDLKEYDLDVCDEWYSGEINEEIFNNTVSVYYNKEIEEEFNLFSYIKNNVWIIIIGGCICLGGIIFIIFRNIKRSELK